MVKKKKEKRKKKKKSKRRKMRKKKKLLFHLRLKMHEQNGAGPCAAEAEALKVSGELTNKSILCLRSGAGSRAEPALKLRARGGAQPLGCHEVCLELGPGVVWGRVMWGRMLWGRMLWGGVLWGRVLWGRVMWALPPHTHRWGCAVPALSAPTQPRRDIALSSASRLKGSRMLFSLC